MGHHHHHHEHNSSQRIGWAFALNASFTIIEFIGGWLTNSTAIMADAVHDLGDSLSIGFAWILEKFSKKQPSERFTYGYKRLSLLAGFINASILVVGSVWVLFQAIPRLFEPVMPEVNGMIALAILGVLVNGFAAFKLSQGETLNEKILNWHLLEDVLGWVAVLLVAIVLKFKQWPILDPLLSIGFTLFIVFNVFSHLKQVVALFLQSSPDKSLYQSVHQAITETPEVAQAHHLHIWSLDGQHHVLSAHIVLQQSLVPEQQLALKKALADKLKPFDFAHSTLEFELPNEYCRDEQH